MASSTTTIRLDDKERAAFEEMAKFEGVRLSTLMKEKMWEAYEDWSDIRAARKARKERERLGDKYVTYSINEVRKRLGLNEL
jgi:Mg/Co/Ni transporter MgtE